MPGAWQGSTLHLRLSPGADRHTIAQITPDALKLLRDVIGQRCGQAIELIPPTAIAARPSPGDSTRNQSYQAAQNDPLVRELLRRFEADIISREPSPRARFLADIAEPPSSES